MTDTELDTARSPSERADEPPLPRPGLDSARRTARAAIERPATDPGTIVQRIRASALSAISWAACRLPEGPQIALAELVGRVAYRASPARTARVRANLRRVIEYLAASDLATDRIRAAAADPRALERLVRAAFRHRARYYLEILRAPGLDGRIFDERLAVENLDVVDAALAGDKRAVFISGHLGPIELPGLYLAQHSGRRITAPMETLGDPALQRWFERTRATFGVRIVGLREARRELLKELEERRVGRPGRGSRHHRRRDGGAVLRGAGAAARRSGVSRHRDRTCRSTSRLSGASGSAATAAGWTRSP